MPDQPSALDSAISTINVAGVSGNGQSGTDNQPPAQNQTAVPPGTASGEMERIFSNSAKFNAGSKSSQLAQSQGDKTPRPGPVGSETEQIPSTPSVGQAPSIASPAAGSRFGYTLDELEQQLQKNPVHYVVDGLLPADDVHVAVGDSGLGKTPWAYQLGLCVADGIQFLGHQVRKSSVLYYDMENGSQEIVDLSRALCGHLGITPFPKDFIVIPNEGNAPDLEEAVAERKPGLVIIDTIRALHPQAEGDNPSMGHVLGKLRGIARKYHCAILLLHHTRKPGEKGAAELDQTPIIEWLNEAAGARALINQTNARIGLERPRTARKEDAALVMKSHVKVKGEAGPYYLERICDGEGEPIGYKRIVGVALLGNQEQETAFENLPDKFSFKQARAIYGKTDNPTDQWLKKCIAAGLLRKVGRGKYEKLELPASSQKAEVTEESG